ncbi:amino-terminal enhancer of split [Cyanistes caeruleus]|uniref:amino-terminal enhancer of split n=1 Tax=Cyanistes caeruleus TaxID=156563 RepID=UPI000CDA6984|nr:amino-terminal enhancer of split [Cyanistes caeruleus]
MNIKLTAEEGERGGLGAGGPGGRQLRSQRCLLLFKGSSHLPQQLKFTTSDSCDRIKDEFQLLQAQYHSLKLECDKLASEKSEMQRHYVMYYEMSYGLNIEMHKQAEIVKRLNGICAQVLPYLSQEHQQQVLGAIERAKQVTAPELNSIIRQQLQAHQLSQLQALALPLTPLPVGLQPPSLPAVSAGTGLLSLSALGSQAHLSKEDKNGHDGDPPLQPGQPFKFSVLEICDRIKEEFQFLQAQYHRWGHGPGAEGAPGAQL